MQAAGSLAEFLATSSLVFQLSANGVNDRLVFSSSGSGLLDFTALASGSIGVVFGTGYNPALFDTFDLIDWAVAIGGRHERR